MNSFPYQEGVDLIIRFMPQECQGYFECVDWNKTMHRKIDYIIQYLEEMSEADIMIHADVDIKFYKPFKQDIEALLGDYDIAFQNDGNCLCMGFFAARKSQRLIDLMRSVKNNIAKYGNDQYAMNALIAASGLKFGVLPPRYYSFGALNSCTNWNVTIQSFNVPKDIILHHANWTVGVDNKIALIRKTEELLKS
jgi:hypothetical protein